MSTAADSMDAVLRAAPGPLVNHAGNAATYLGLIAAGTGIACAGAMIGSGDTDWQVAARVGLFTATVVLAVLAVVFGALGMWGRPKRPGVTGFVIGLVAFFGFATFLVVFVPNRTSGASSFSTYTACIAAPETTYAECNAEFGR